MSPGAITPGQLEHCLTAPLFGPTMRVGIRGCTAATSRYLGFFRSEHCRAYARAADMCTRLYTRSLRTGYSDILCEYYRWLHYKLECGRQVQHHAACEPDTSFVDKWEAAVFGPYNDTIGAMIAKALECAGEPGGDDAMQTYVIEELRGMVQ